jgi:hypothetical protein
MVTKRITNPTFMAGRAQVFPYKEFQSGISMTRWTGSPTL